MSLQIQWNISELFHSTSLQTDLGLYLTTALMVYLLARGLFSQTSTSLITWDLLFCISNIEFSQKKIMHYKT